MRIHALTACLILVCSYGCKPRAPQSSELRITNGEDIDFLDYPEVVRLQFSVDGRKVGNCTGTFVSHNTVLTAAHCRRYKNSEARFQTAPDKYSEPAKQILIHPKYTRAGPFDLAVLLFSDRASMYWATIAPNAPQKGDPLVIVGFGRKNHNDTLSAHVKRLGHNVVDAVSGGVIEFSGVLSGPGTGEDAASSQGDSGGPMFVNGLLVGVTSSGSMPDEQKKSTYVNVNSQWSKPFLQDALTQGALIHFSNGN